jgi:hypothetical protein
MALFPPQETGRPAPAGLPAPLHAGGDASPHPPAAIEAVMIAEGSLIRTGPRDDELIPIEDLGAGDPVWDCLAGRLVDVETIACATLGPQELAEQGLRAVSLDPCTTIAIASPRLRRMAVPDRSDLQDGERVFYRLWPETRIHAQVNGAICLMQPAKWG